MGRPGSRVNTPVLHRAAPTRRCTMTLLTQRVVSCGYDGTQLLVIRGSGGAPSNGRNTPAHSPPPHGPMLFPDATGKWTSLVDSMATSPRNDVAMERSDWRKLHLPWFLRAIPAGVGSSLQDQVVLFGGLAALIRQHMDDDAPAGRSKCHESAPVW